MKIITRIPRVIIPQPLWEQVTVIILVALITACIVAALMVIG